VLGEWLGRQDAAAPVRLPDRDQGRQSARLSSGRTPPEPRTGRPSLDESLRRLGVERIDLYYLHEFDPLTPLEETLEALDRALGQGKIAAFGVSNATLKDLKAVLALAGGALRGAFTHVQNEFNLLAQGDLAQSSRWPGPRGCVTSPSAPWRRPPEREIPARRAG